MTKCEFRYIQRAKSMIQPVCVAHAWMDGSTKKWSLCSSQMTFVAFQAARPALSSTIPRTMR